MYVPFLVALPTSFIIALGTVAIAQKVLTPGEFSQAMKRIGTSIEAVKRAVESKAYLDAKPPLALARETLASSRPFWQTHRKDDAVTLTKRALVQLDALDQSLSASVVDAAAVETAFQELTRGCEACHRAYREGDRQTGYRIKLGSF